MVLPCRNGFYARPFRNGTTTFHIVTVCADVSIGMQSKNMGISTSKRADVPPLAACTVSHCGQNASICSHASGHAITGDHMALITIGRRIVNLVGALNLFQTMFGRATFYAQFFKISEYGTESPRFDLSE